MKRREFTKVFGSGALALTVSGLSHSATASKPQVAITMDDFDVSKLSKSEAEKRTGAILSALRSHGNLQAAGFICGRRVDNDNGPIVLSAWDKAGHLICNHTYSHWYFHNRSVQEFSEDILRAEPLIKNYSHFTKRFRFPMLKEGNTIERRDGLRAFLKAQGYQQGYVTIDASDWYIDDRMTARLKQAPGADLQPYRDFYLNHIWERATYYDDLSRKVLGRGVKHTLLIHYSLLNEHFLGDLLTMFERRGWQLINAETAFKDEVFEREPKILPAGESIIWALAKESGKFEKLLRYPGEDDVYEKPKMDKLRL
jgi:peptidoglycan/xylan/chitin deacetylase (PgdA/CDA1 family)